MAKKKTQPNQILNRRATFDYQIVESYQAGLVLNGRETKAIRMGKADLSGAYVNFVADELWLIGATVFGTSGVPISESEQKQNRKLLLKKSEMKKLLEKKQSGLTIIPVKINTKGRYIKIEIALAKGKREYDKRQTIKKRDTDRDLRRKANI